METLTVGISTWNRAGSLEATLEALLASDVPKGCRREVIVADNNSTDGTSDLLRRYAGQEGVIHLYEDRQGKSFAHNKIIDTASGRYILWIDDDIIVDKRWMVEYCKAFERWPAAAIFGGTIRPFFVGTPPQWIQSAPREIGGVYGLCEPIDASIQEGDSPLPFGGNMAVQTEAQKRYRFNTSMGRRAGELLTGEESELVSRMLRDGFEGRWVPRARVQHVVPPEMQTLAYVRRYFHDFGATLRLTQGEGAALHRKVPPTWIFRDAIQQEVLFRLRKMFGRDSEALLRNLRAAALAQGWLRGRPMRTRGR